MIFCLVLAGTGAAVVSAFLGRTLYESNRMEQRYNQTRAHWRAVAQLEVARNVIYTAGYTGGVNDAIADALASNPSVIAGTSVVVEPAGPVRWYRLVCAENYEGSEAVSVTFVRDHTTYASFNYYVESDPLGISGETDGKIHSNETVELHFEGGVHRGSVNAGTGLEFLNGASEENTTFHGEVNASADPLELLSDISFAELESSANYVAPSGTLADIQLLGDTIEIQLTTSSATMTSSTLMSGIESTNSTNDDSGSGELITAESITVATYPAAGVFYFPGDIRSVQGELNGHLTLVSDGSIEITDHLRYVDGEGDTAYLHGADPSQPYTPNPDFTRNHSLALIAQQNVHYKPTGQQLEVNAALVAVTGTVSIGGVEINNGEPVVTGSPAVFQSLRRLGCIMSDQRPVMSVLDANGDVMHGFETGQAQFDAALKITPPPSYPEQPKPMFWVSYGIGSSSAPDAGSGDVGNGTTLLEGLLRGNLDPVINDSRNVNDDLMNALENSDSSGAVQQVIGGSVGGSTDGMNMQGTGSN